jgi:hypothetical protein
VTYLVEIRCDVEADGRCASRQGLNRPGPSASDDDAAHAARLARNAAGSAGWVHQRRAGRSTIWICPACQQHPDGQRWLR